MNIDYSKLFKSNDEKFLAVLGGSYALEYQNLGATKGSFVLVSDKNVYVYGKHFIPDVSGKEIKSSKSLYYSISEFKGLKVFLLRAMVLHRALLAVNIILVLSLIFNVYIIGVTRSNPNLSSLVFNIFQVSLFIFLISLPVAIVLNILVPKKHKEIIELSFSGGLRVVLNYRWFDSDDVNDFLMHVGEIGIPTSNLLKEVIN